MPKTNVITQIYGYAVCLTAVITFLVAVTNLVMSALDYSNPLQSQEGWRSNEPGLASFEIYQIDIAEALGDRELPDEQKLRVMYEAARADKISSVQFRARRSMVVHSLLIVICAILFFTHWRWLQRLPQ
jgi:hypothetical protein